MLHDLDFISFYGTFDTKSVLMIDEADFNPKGSTETFFSFPTFFSSQKLNINTQSNPSENDVKISKAHPQIQFLHF